MTLWIVLILMGVVTYGLRLSLIGLTGRWEVPPLVSRGLRFVPPAVLSAIIAPELVLPNGALNLSLSNLRLVAGVLAIVVAWRTRNVLLTVGLGMAALWLLSSMAR